MTHPTIHRTACGCECGCGAMLVTFFEQWGDEPEDLYLDVSVAYHGTLRHRARAAWRILRAKDPWLHGMMFQGETLKRFREAIR